MFVNFRKTEPANQLDRTSFNISRDARHIPHRVIGTSEISPYSQDHFRSLPSLNNTQDRFLRLDSDKLIKGLFKDFFINNGMDRTFGLAMPHRHFDILPRQIISVNPSEGIDEPQPAVWNFSSTGELIPTEFSYSKGPKAKMGEKERAFVASLKRLLDEKNLSEVFGLCEYLGDDFEGICEITISSANINLKPKDFFSPPLRKRGCRCTCDNRTAPYSHGTHIITQSA
ncbi:hypothetical protein BU23DRAFT_589810 [Bimuria novae-zelandiae CBS 107.79]|uniref:Uncharacterized protein n=1 Tax=Bimuria novae-zelandiae CBS 107.79 TaxID=1447943 RepID=A0A6A5V6Y3_9PLEO|nr:hypothetical protein BU23DRAFT_589810 [Bimuria novae-zelandiae CBS 107.79]